MYTGFEQLRDGEYNRLLLLGLEGTLSRRDGEPLGQAVNRILARHTGLVGDNDRHLHFGRRLIIHRYLQHALVPSDAIEIRIDSPCDRRRESVTVEVLYIAYGKVHRAFVDLTRLCLDINQQFGFLIRPVERQVGEQSSVANRRVVMLVGLRSEIVHEQRLDLIHCIAVGIAEDALVIGRVHLLHHARGVTFDPRESEQIDQTHLFAVRRLLAELGNEFRRQGLLEETYIVDVTFQSACHPYSRAGERTDTYRRE